MTTVSDVAVDLVRVEVEQDHERVDAQMSMQCTPSELALRNRIASENGWTLRKTTVLALQVLDATLKQIKEEPPNDH